MLLAHPVKKVYITQEWGKNPQLYSQYGLKGHNGIDYRAFLPNGERCYVGDKSEVFAPHDGKVIENRLDSGYGNYVKIENSKEGSILAHFSKLSPLKVGQTIKQGDFVGYQGTTGNSTGIHLHWGYYPIPRNRSNGYSGTINQLPLISTTQNDMTDSIQVEKKVFEKLVANSTTADLIVKYLGLADNADNIGFETIKNSLEARDGKLTSCKNELSTRESSLAVALQEVSNREEQVSRLKDELLNQSKLHKAELNALKSTLTEPEKIIAEYQSTIEQLQSDFKEEAKLKGNALNELAEAKSQLETAQKGQYPDLSFNSWLNLFKLIKWF